jgi:hypothetical protein
MDVSWKVEMAAAVIGLLCAMLAVYAVYRRGPGFSA